MLIYLQVYCLLLLLTYLFSFLLVCFVCLFMRLFSYFTKVKFIDLLFRFIFCIISIDLISTSISKNYFHIKKIFVSLLFSFFLFSCEISFSIIFIDYQISHNHSSIFILFTDCLFLFMINTSNLLFLFFYFINFIVYFFNLFILLFINIFFYFFHS